LTHKIYLQFIQNNFLLAGNSIFFYPKIRGNLLCGKGSKTLRRGEVIATSSVSVTVKTDDGKKQVISRADVRVPKVPREVGVRGRRGSSESSEASIDSRIISENVSEDIFDNEGVFINKFAGTRYEKKALELSKRHINDYVYFTSDEGLHASFLRP
jgi:hypothetical protein